MDTAQIAVEFRYFLIGQSGRLMEPIDVLSDTTGHPIVLPQADHGVVSAIGTYLEHATQEPLLMHHP